MTGRIWQSHHCFLRITFLGQKKTRTLGPGLVFSQKYYAAGAAFLPFFSFSAFFFSAS
jgi:hypothetical protein